MSDRIAPDRTVSTRAEVPPRQGDANRCGAHPHGCQFVTCQLYRGHERDHLAQASDLSWAWHWPLTHVQRKWLKREAPSQSQDLVHDNDCECSECVDSDRELFGRVADRLERTLRPEGTPPDPAPASEGTPSEGT